MSVAKSPRCKKKSFLGNSTKLSRCLEVTLSTSLRTLILANTGQLLPEMVLLAAQTEEQMNNLNSLPKTESTASELLKQDIFQPETMATWIKSMHAKAGNNLNY